MPAMPRANRYILPDNIYHITHRCGNGEYLLRFRQDRDTYRNWLVKGSQRHDISVLGYCITSNHVHLIVTASSQKAVSSMVQLAAGCTAQQYNNRKQRTGPFWEDRFHCTLIDSGSYFWNCLSYIDLNMVRAGVVDHPSEWKWTGYREFAGLKKRYRAINVNSLLEKLEIPDIDKARKKYETFLRQRKTLAGKNREPQWTESLAVGSEPFVQAVANQTRNRTQLDVAPVEKSTTGTWQVKEVPPAYR